ncbi:MAG TPA: response regulator transcription factor [Longimicrobiales bacterium]|nr:response regulator transcription factor [Longimicrobiales bacterium]
MTSNKALRVVIADDHPLVVEGMQVLLNGEEDIDVVATATDGERALDAARRLHPDLLILDLEMPYLGGLACLRQIRSEALPVRVLILSAFSDAHTLREAIENGADGFALKTGAPEATLAAIRQVANGQLVFPQAARRWLTDTQKSTGPSNQLTDREEDVFRLLAEGASNAHIANALSLSESTVKFHLRNLFAKLGVTNRTEAAARYHRRT